MILAKLFQAKRIPASHFFNLTTGGNVDRTSLMQSILRLSAWVAAWLVLSTAPALAQDKPVAKPAAKPIGQMHPCRGAEKTCVEVTLQYHDNGRVELVDSKNRAAIPNCRLCDPNDKECTMRCKAGGTITHGASLQLLKSHASPGCTTICYRSGWCKESCN